MTPKEAVPGGAGIENSVSKTRDALVGRVLYERFLIEGDLTPDMAAGRYSRYLAKDVRNYCRRVIVTAIGREGDVGRSNTFQEICETLIALDHPNVEWFLEAGRLFDGRPYAVSTYTLGSTLDEILAGGRRLVLERAANVIESVGEALEAAHSRKIIHGGVSPANIIISPQEHEDEGVRLAGFGIAWPQRRGDNDITDVEWPAFAAPEMMTPDGRAAIASDIYSLAAVAYRMLTGHVPFPAADHDELLGSIARGLALRPSELRTDLPADAEALIVTALQYKASMRPRDARAFARELAAELRGRPEISIITLPEVEDAHEPEPAPEKTPEPKFEEAISEISFKYLAGMPAEETRSRSGRRPSNAVSDRAITWSLIVLLLAGALSIPIVQAISQNRAQPQPISAASIVKRPANAGVPRELRYRVDPPEAGASNEFRMTFDADSPGNAYVFSETRDEQGRPVFDVLYPLAKLNAGSAHVEPNQSVRTRPAALGDPQNRPTIWLVWTAGRQEDLEAARRSAADGDGAVRDPDEAEKVKHFLERNKNNQLDLSTENQQNILNGSGDKIVHRIDPGEKPN